MALQRFEAAERHVADASINDASVFYLNRGNLRLQRLELSSARRDFDRCITLAAALDGADASKMKVSEFWLGAIWATSNSWREICPGRWR